MAKRYRVISQQVFSKPIGGSNEGWLEDKINELNDEGYYLNSPLTCVNVGDKTFVMAVMEC